MQGIGVCSAFPGSIPKDAYACYAYNGSCYVCDKSESYIDCKADWLWNYNFPTHSWFKQVDCYDPYEEESCVDDSGVILLKKTKFNRHEVGSYNDNYTFEFVPNSKTYDALGRRLYIPNHMHKISFKRNESKIKSPSNLSFNVGDVIYIPVGNEGISQNYLARKGDVCSSYSCGNYGKDYGITDIGVYCGRPCTEIIEENGLIKLEIVGKERTGTCGRNDAFNKYELTLKMFASVTIMNKDKYRVVDVGKRVGDKVVTQEVHDAGVRHEKGHMNSYSCLETEKMLKTDYEFKVVDVCEKSYKCDDRDVIRKISTNLANELSKEKEKKALVTYNDNIWQQMCGWYHKTYSREEGPGGTDSKGNKYPNPLECPSKETLLNFEYDLTGCEVH